MKKMRKSVAGITAVSAAWLAAAAVAAPQESVTFNGVDSNGAANSAVNEVRTHAFTGGYSPKSFRLQGDIAQVVGGSFQSEAMILVTPPSGVPFEVQTSLRGSPAFVGTSTVDVTLPIPTKLADAAGTWSFRFFESFDDGGTTAIDANWTSITITLDDALPVGGAAATGAGAFFEVEPNDATFFNMGSAAFPLASSFGAANTLTMAVGDSITGNAQGSVTTNPGGANSVDNFLIQTAPDAPALYRYQLTLSSAVAGHTATIRGASQSTNLGTGNPGAIRIGSDGLFQTGQTVAPNRISQWYGFGGGEAVHYRVAGTASTTADYTATLSRSTVSPVVAGSTVAAGNVSFTRAGHTNTVDVLLLDSSYNTLASWHGMTSGAMTRNLSPGTYYMVVSNATTSDNGAASGDSTTRTNAVTNMPGVLANTSTTTVANLAMNIVDGLGSQTVSGSKAAAFDVQLYQFTVATVTTPPSGVGSSVPASAMVNDPALLRVTVTPGTNPPSTNIAVVADLSSIGGSASQTFFDDGTNGDVTGGDNIFSYAVTAPGTVGGYSMPFTVSDGEARSSGGNINLTVFAPPTATDLGTLANGSNTAPILPVGLAEVQWYKFVLPSEVSAANANWLDIVSDGALSGGTFTNDTIMALYNADGTVRASDDDDGPGAFSTLTFGQTTPTRANGTGLAHNGRDGTLAAGTYYLVISGYNCLYAANFGLTPTSNSAGSVGGTLFLGPAPSAPTVVGGTANGLAGGTALFTATVTPGALPTSTNLAVNADLTAIGGSATNAMYDDGTNGDVTSNDNVFSLIVSIPGAQAAGPYSVPLVVSDGESRSSNGSGTINVDEAGQTLATALNVDGVGAVTSISGIATSGDVDLYRIFICDPANFNASTVGGASFDTQLFLFNADGTGVVMNDDDATGTAQSAITNELTSTLAPGAYYLAISPYNIDARDSANALIFPNSAAVACNGGVFRCQLPPTSATAVLDNWTTGATGNGTYTITLAGVNGEPCALPCGTADFDGDGDIGTDADIEAFFACLAGNCCATCYAGGADFDADGDIGTDADIESFFRVLAGGPC
jgi:hypothetical protein